MVNRMFWREKVSLISHLNRNQRSAIVGCCIRSTWAVYCAHISGVMPLTKLVVSLPVSQLVETTTRQGTNALLCCTPNQTRRMTNEQILRCIKTFLLGLDCPISQYLLERICQGELCTIFSKHWASCRVKCYGPIVHGRKERKMALSSSG